MEELTRRALGINGKHNRLGQEISEAEFRGYVIAKQEERDKQIEELHKKIDKTHDYIKDLLADAKKVHDGLDGRITVLEKEDAASKGFVAGITVVAAFISAIVSAIITAGAIKLFGL